MGITQIDIYQLNFYASLSCIFGSCYLTFVFLKLVTYNIKTAAMIIVHDIFICKPGQASKMAKLFKEAMAENIELVNIMTDMTGQFNKVVMVSQYESLTAYEESWEKYSKDDEAVKKMKEKMKGYHDMYLTGSREVYQVW